VKKIVLLLLALSVMAGDFVNGSNTCPSSGAIQVSSTGYSLYQLTVSANLSNAGKVYVGGSNVTTSNGTVLTPGSAFWATKPNNGVNPTTLYFTCDNSTDGITWIGSR